MNKRLRAVLLNVIGNKREVTKLILTRSSTDIKGHTFIDNLEKRSFIEESELKKIGYKIIGLTREKRWSFLEFAVRQIGHRKVAHTIARYN